MRRERHLKALALCSVSMLAISVTQTAYANPEGGQVVGGSATIEASDKKLDVYQHTDRAVIDWRSFNIEVDEHTQFHQPSSGAIALNRVNSNDPSHIMGKLSANGNIVLINPNGVFFGRDSRVDVNGLIATTADIDTHDFMGGSLKFDKSGNPNAAVVNEGHITAKEAGLVALVAPNVANSGVIEARLGRVELASGDGVTADLYGDGLYELKVSDAVASQLVSNTGNIHAEGGTIAITAAAGKEIVNSLITINGELKAPAVQQQGGKIIIAAAGSNAVAGNKAEDKGNKQGSSTVLIANAYLDASGRKEGERGGSITVTGDNVALLGGTVIDASGHTGKSGTTEGKIVSDYREGAAGGDIRIGGDYLGQGETATAKNLYVDEGALIVNDALHEGDAGRTIFWSDDTTHFYGSVYARALGGAAVDMDSWQATAGGNAGDGGFVETSGYKHLDAGGYVDLTASGGNRGTYFLDPTNITIYGNFSPSSISGLSLWLDPTDASTISQTGGLVDQWRDKSGNNNHASGSLTARAATGSRTINGQNVIKFDGVNDVLTIADSASLDFSTQFSLFMVNSLDALTLPAGLLSKRVTSGSQDAFSFFYNTGNKLYVDVNTSNNRFASNTVYGTTGETLYQSAVYDGTLAAANRVTLFNGGTADIVGSESSSSIPNYTSDLLIGQLGGNAGSFLNGVVGDVLLFNTTLSTNNRYLVDQYLSAKWGSRLTPPGVASVASDVAEATAAMAHDAGDPTKGYSVFTSRYLERLSQSANVSLQASNDINLDLQGDTLNLTTAGRSLTLNAGNQITTASAGNITTNNGAISLTGANGIVFSHAFGLNSNGATITFNNPVTLGAALTTNSGSGSTTFSGTVNGAHNLTAAAGTFSFGGALGGSTPLSAVSLTSNNSITLPAVSASTILARVTGGNLTLGGNLTASGAGNAIVLNAGDTFSNAGNYTLSPGTGRYLIFNEGSTSASISKGGLAGFNRYGCTYNAGAPSCAVGTDTPATGNGFYFAYAPTLTIGGITGSNKVYDATTTATVSGAATLSGLLYGDTVTLDASGATFQFADAAIGVNKPITASGYALSGTNHGYLLSQPTGLTASITDASGSGGTTDSTTVLPSTVLVVSQDPMIINAYGQATLQPDWKYRRRRILDGLVEIHPSLAKLFGLDEDEALI